MLARIFFVAIALLSFSCPASAQRALENAWRAQALLGADTWSRVVQVENRTVGGDYPRTVYALVFEFAGILWFYTDANGTQSFSLRRGQLEAEKRDFAPLLRDIDPGFGRWSVVSRKMPELPPLTEPLRNGCFIESVAALRQRIARGEPIAEPRLLSYYLDTADGRLGHTVLAVEVRGKLEIFDPARPDAVFDVAPAAAATPLALAQAIEPRAVSAARFLPVPMAPRAQLANTAANAEAAMGTAG